MMENYQISPDNLFPILIIDFTEIKIKKHLKRIEFVVIDF